MAKKAADFLKKLDDKHPHMTLDIEFDGEEIPIVFRNILRLTDEEQKEVADALEILRVVGDRDLPENFVDEIFTEEEREQTFTRVYVERLVRAMRAAARRDDKELFDEFITGCREQLEGDFLQFIIAVFDGYCEETRLGEAGDSASS